MEPESHIKIKSKIAGTIITIFVAFAVLMVSVLKSAKTNFAYEPKNLAYSPMVLSESVESEKAQSIDYLLAYPGKVGPDHPLWYAKVIRDKAWLALTFNANKKAELNLLFADKRLSSAVELFKNNKPDLGIATLTKSEKYLETAESIMTDDDNFYKKIGLSSLKHREVIENEILPISPEDLRPQIIKTEDYSKEVYKKVKDHMLTKGLTPPVNPFETN